MANPERGEMSLVMGGVSYTLRLTVNACCDLEAQSGHSWHWHLNRWKESGDTTPIVWLLWAALQNRHAATFPTIRAVGDQMDDANPDELKTVMLAFALLNDDIRERLERNGLLPRVVTRPPKAQAEEPTRLGSGPTSKPASSST